MGHNVKEEYSDKSTPEAIEAKTKELESKIELIALMIKDKDENLKKEKQLRMQYAHMKESYTEWLNKNENIFPVDGNNIEYTDINNRLTDLKTRIQELNGLQDNFDELDSVVNSMSSSLSENDAKDVIIYV